MQASLGVAVMAALSDTSATALASPQSTAKRSLRLAHLTDTHLGTELSAPRGLASCLQHVHAQLDRPDMVITGGDNIYDAFGADATRTGQLWDLWNQQLREHCSLPVEHCIGNRDIWGWDKAKSKTTGAEKRWGKAWALEAMRLERSYRSFDRGRWHIVVLDSIAPDPDPSNTEAFQARLDEEQFDWLAGDLAAHSDMHTLIVSHVPIVCACVFFDDLYEKSGNWAIPRAWMHIDARRITDLFAKHSQVKACIAGHIHQVDRVDFQGVSYFCNGAVCGDWWKGPNRQCECGYALVDLFDDGSVANQYIPYGWVYQK